MAIVNRVAERVASIRTVVDVAADRVLVSCLPIPVLGDSPAVITLDPGAPVHVEKLGDALELLEDRVGNARRRRGEHARPSNTGFVSATPEIDATSASRRRPGGCASRCAILRTSSRLVYLRQDYPLIDSLDLYEPRPMAAGGVHSTGDRKPFSSRDVEHRDFLFPLTLPANSDRTFYLRLRLARPGRHQPVAARSQ